MKTTPVTISHVRSHENIICVACIMEWLETAVVCTFLLFQISAFLIFIFVGGCLGEMAFVYRNTKYNHHGWLGICLQNRLKQQLFDEWFHFF